MPDKKKKKTRVAVNRHRQRNPIFNAFLYFDVDVMELPNKRLQIQLWELNPMGNLYTGCTWIRQPRHNCAQPHSA